jgi:hypothetical protein
LLHTLQEAWVWLCSGAVVFGALRTSGVVEPKQQPAQVATCIQYLTTLMLQPLAANAAPANAHTSAATIPTSAAFL